MFLIHETSKKTYEAGKIKYELKHLYDIDISLSKCQRLMKKLEIKSIIVSKYKPKGSSACLEYKENLLNQDFTSSSINAKWATDITYIKTIKDGWCYLANVIALFSRKIIGFKLSKTMNSNLVISALDNTIVSQNPQNHLILHSDLGFQYTSKDFDNYIDAHPLITHSFSKKGCP